MKKIKFLVLDVDGTLTDGKIYMGSNGELFKAFDVKDGCGIKELLPAYEIIPVIITARESKIVKNRCAELGIREVHQGIRKKLDKLKEIVAAYNKEFVTEYSLKDCAYIGDDILDLQCMEPIKLAGGLVGCPKDAIKAVVEQADYVTECKGGGGAVREFIEWIVHEKNSKLSK